MPTEVIMPSLGESVVEGTVTKWLKAKGDKVEEYEPLLEVNTDKVDSEIPSPASGVLLDVLVPEGTTIQAGALLAWIGDQGETTPTDGGATDGAAIAQAAGESPRSNGKQEPFPATVMPAAGRDRDLGFISPVVARIAQEQKVDLYQVAGTGQGGRITKKDILNYLEAREKGAEAPPSEASAASTPAPEKPPVERRPERPLEASGVEGSAPVLPSPDEEVQPLTAVRRAIAEHMVLSKRTSPHVTTVMEVDLSRIVTHREANKAVFARDGANLTYTAYFVAATVAALQAQQIVNSSWTDEGIQFHREINIGMATSLGEAGLIVPVIKNAGSLSLLGLARTINDLANRARARQLKPDEVKGGTFTITNHGTSGSLFATPIINQPQCGILGVGAIQKRVVVITDPTGADMMAIRPMAYLTLTFDHRILDGAIADHFLGKVVESLKNWS